MTEWFLFTDGSVHPQTKCGCGAALLIGSDELTLSLDVLRSRIIVHKFTDTSSTKLELQTLLWALAETSEACAPLSVYTDSQNILSLPDRRAGFEAHHYLSKKGLPLRNAALYQAFFQLMDQRELRLVKVKGHKPAAHRNSIDRLFKLVDKASRNACRNEEI
jgi:ribonuclease HI